MRDLTLDMWMIPTIFRAGQWSFEVIKGHNLSEHDIVRRITMRDHILGLWIVNI